MDYLNRVWTQRKMLIVARSSFSVSWELYTYEENKEKGKKGGGFIAIVSLRSG